MKITRFLLLVGMVVTLFSYSCNQSNEQEQTEEPTMTEMEKKVNDFASFKLTTDLTTLTEKEKQMLPLLFEAASIMNDVFWIQAFGDKQVVLDSAKDEATKKFVEINYGPWERLNDNKPFIESFGEKPAGANFYPKDMTAEEFEAFDAADKKSLYTMIRRDEEGKLKSIPYSEFFKEQYVKVADLLKKASELAEDEGLKKYLELRAETFLTNEYFDSDMAWMDMKTNGIDIVYRAVNNLPGGK